MALEPIASIAATQKIRRLITRHPSRLELTLTKPGKLAAKREEIARIPRDGGSLEGVEGSGSRMGIVGTHPGSFRKSGKQRRYGIRNLEEHTEDGIRRGRMEERASN